MQEYIGRFAPSPTGPLHMGSLIAALASFLEARSNQGQWLLRMEDLDPPREEEGAARAILQSLQDHGLYWDGEVMWQSQRHSVYRAAVDQLLNENKAFYCACSRTDLQASRGVHAGRCCDAGIEPDKACAIRLEVPDLTVAFEDVIQGVYTQPLKRDVGDFVLRRKDGLYAYQLAVVVDDAAQGITHVVRGSDLLDSTPRQLWLQQALGLQPAGTDSISSEPVLHYAHIPVLTNAEGQKLSKQTFAPGLSGDHVRDNLLYALAFLQQPVPVGAEDIKSLLAFAITHWDLQRVPKQLSISQSSCG